jgi:hypothetical protein
MHEDLCELGQFLKCKSLNTCQKDMRPFLNCLYNDALHIDVRGI